MLVLQSVLIKLTSQQPEFCESFKNTYILQNTSKYLLLKTAETCTAPKIKFSIKDLFSKCDCSKLRNFCAVMDLNFDHRYDGDGAYKITSN